MPKCVIIYNLITYLGTQYAAQNPIPMQKKKCLKYVHYDVLADALHASKIRKVGKGKETSSLS